jgi:NAD(P)-dependent dehydrogenase (short-subunit alcohol dehydrogenase family)
MARGVAVTRAGFIGLGSQGAGMAERLIELGLPTTLWARRPASLTPSHGRVAVFGTEPDPGMTYRLAKRGVIRLSERAAVIWGERGGRVVSLSPGLMVTEMGRLELDGNPIKTWMMELTPLRVRDPGRDTVLPGRAEDIASAVAFLCSDAASFVSGCDLRDDGGLIAAMDQQAT